MLPTLSRLSVRTGPAGRLRHECSPLSLRISPLHREFLQPLPASSLTVSADLTRLSRALSRRTYKTTYAPFTPNNSEQRLPLPYYRGCWHGISRGFLWGYRQNSKIYSVLKPFFPPDRSLQPEGLRPPRGVTASGFRPLRKIPHCCLP